MQKKGISLLGFGKAKINKRRFLTLPTEFIDYYGKQSSSTETSYVMRFISSTIEITLVSKYELANGQSVESVIKHLMNNK